LIAGSFFSITGANAATHHTVKAHHAKVSHVKSASVTPTPTPSTGTTPLNYPTSGTTPPNYPTTPPVSGGHTPETPITGDLDTTLSNLALAQYPGATIVRVETDSDGAASEVHLTTADGKNVTITFDANNAIVATKVNGPGFGPRGDHAKGPHGDQGKPGHGDNDGDGHGDGDDDGAASGFTLSTPTAPITPLNG
jgi:hypothetical protein